MVWRAIDSSILPQPALARNSRYSAAEGSSSAKTIPSISCLACAAGLVPALRLAHIHGAVGLLERGAHFRMAVEDGDADRGAGPHRVAVERETQGIDRLLQFGRLGPGIGLAEIPQEYRELIAAEPADDVGGAHLARQRLRNRLQQCVAGGLPERMVYRLESIEVEHRQRVGRRMDIDEGDRALKLARKTAPVENVEHEIGLGRGLQLYDFASRGRQLLA